MMELYIETLTGTAFELRVSPFETVISVKAKIQRLEGIPISQQHLIWQSTELDDESCLHDYDIHSGATLKLVLAMRGGPINTRRIPTEDPMLREMAEYMEANRDDIMENLPNGSGGSAGRQVTLLVFREGDQLNFFRVVDRGDGTVTPLPESLSAASMYNLCDEEEEAEPPTQEKEEENNRIRDKMQSLRSKMGDLSLGKQAKRVGSDGHHAQMAQPLQPAPPLLPPPPRSKSGRPRPPSLRAAAAQPEFTSATGSSVGSVGHQFVRGPSGWPPASAAAAVGSRRAAPAPADVGLTARHATATAAHPMPLHRASSPASTEHPPTLLRDLSRGTSSIGGAGGLPQLQPAGQLLTSAVRSSSSYARQLSSNGTGIGVPYQQPSIPEHEAIAADAFRAQQQQQRTPPQPLLPAAGAAIPPNRERRRSSQQHRSSLERLRESPMWPPLLTDELLHPTAAAGSGSGSGGVGLGSLSSPGWPASAAGRSDDGGRSRSPSATTAAARQPQPQPMLPRRASSSRRRAVTVARELADSQQLPAAAAAATGAVPATSASTVGLGRLALESLSTSEAQAVAAGLLQQASHLERLGTSTISGGSVGAGSSQGGIGSGSSQGGGGGGLGISGGSSRGPAGRRPLALPLVDDAAVALSAAAAAAAAESGGTEAVALSARLLSHLTTSVDGVEMPSQLLPPVKPHKKASGTSRCFVCSKKTGLATSYSCRCGNNFCATHRYAELHDCTFDYKTEGRKLLEQSNPVVSAPKLPKI